MAPTVMNDAYIAIGGTNVSQYAHTVTMDDKAEQVEVTTFGPSSYKQYIQGNRDAQVVVSFYSDYSAGATSISTALQALYNAGGTISVEVRSSSGAASPTNPKATMTGRLYNFGGIGGKVGEAATFDATFLNAGTAGLVWGTA